jgi:hypothetical protein
MSKDEKATSTKKTNGKNADQPIMNRKKTILNMIVGTAEKEVICATKEEGEVVGKTSIVMTKDIEATNAIMIAEVENRLF